MNLNRAEVTSEKLEFVGFPLSSWAFALRSFAAMMAALYAAFWLQIGGASSAMVCAAILALPTRGPALEKSAYRFLGTAIGVIASIVIAGLFAQIRELFILAFAAWLGLCVYVSSYFGGNRAYGAVLSGYTVAIVAMMQIDTPQNIFLDGINRGAAIALGIAAVALINIIFAAPDMYPDLSRRLRRIHWRVNEFVLSELREDADDPSSNAQMLQQLTAFRTEIMSLTSESSAGRIRAAAARNAIGALCEEIFAVRAFIQAQRSVGFGEPSLRKKLVSSLKEGSSSGEALRLELEQGLSNAELTLEQIVVRRYAADLLDRDSMATEALSDMQSGRMPERLVSLPAHRVQQLAQRDGIRSAVAVVVTATVCALSGWPETFQVVAFVAIIGALSTTMPKPLAFAKVALLAVPISCITAGVVEFLILDGTDDFGIFAVAVAPPTFVFCLLMESSSVQLRGLGRLGLVYFVLILSPSNPQVYNPQNYLFSSVLVCVAVLEVVLFFTMVLPASDNKTRRWLLDAGLMNVIGALANRHSKSDVERVYLASDQLAQLADLKGPSDAAWRGSVIEMQFLVDLAAAVARAQDYLDEWYDIANSESFIGNARAALDHLDSERLRQSATDAIAMMDGRTVAEQKVLQRTAAALVWISLFIAAEPRRVQAIGT